MLELQNAVGSMMEFLLNGGAAAAKDLLKGMVVKGAVDVSKLWHEVFQKDTKTKQLVDRLAQDPQDLSAQTELRALLEDMLRQHPGLRQQAQKVIKAKKTINAINGSVAAETINNTIITINK
jgi:hypothetical protein